MSAKVESLPGERLKGVATASAALTLLIGLTAMAGWAFGYPVLTQFFAARSAMQPMTALCGILAAASILAARRAGAGQAWARALAAIVIVAAAQTLVQHLFDVDLGTDHLLFADAVDAQPVPYANPGRMAPPSAAAFLLIGIALLAAPVPAPAAGRLLSACATAVLFLVTIALLGHLYGVAPLTGLLAFTQVSVPTATALGGLSIGALALRPGGGWVSLVAGNSVGAASARWLLPVVVIVPIAVAATTLHASSVGLFPADFRLALTTAFTVILLAALALWGTRQVDTLVSVRRAAAELRESEATLRAFFETQGLFASLVERRGDDVRYLLASNAFSSLLGHADVTGRALGDLVPEAAAQSLLAQLKAAEATGVASSAEQAVETSAGTRWFLATISPVTGSPADAPRFATASLEITDRKRAEAHQQLLLQELNHRVKNTLAVVQSLAQQTFRGDQASPAAKRAFDARLAAVATAHNLLVRQDWSAASLRALAGDVAGPGCGADRARVTLEGEDLELPPRTAVSLALALHELCTNAVKYGALSNEAGHVTVRWTVEGDPARLKLSWTEEGGPPVVMPSQRGFGSRLIERALAAELNGQVKLDFLPQGLVCTIDAPLPVD